MGLQHVQRMDTNRLPKQALQYKPKGRRNVGRPRKRWRDQLHLEDQGIGNTPNSSWTWWWWWWNVNIHRSSVEPLVVSHVWNCWSVCPMWNALCLVLYLPHSICMSHPSCALTDCGAVILTVDLQSELSADVYVTLCISVVRIFTTYSNIRDLCEWRHSGLIFHMILTTKNSDPPPVWLVFVT